MRSLGILSLLILSSLLIPGCSDSLPMLTSVETAVVYDYSSQELSPRQRLSVFVHSSEDAARIMELTVFHQESGLRWIVEEPLVIGVGTEVFAGSSCLLPPYFSDIPVGEYHVTYTDLAGQSTTEQFTLRYQGLPAPDLLQSPFDPLGGWEGGDGENGGFEPKLAVYKDVDGAGTLLFFGKALPDWIAAPDVKASYPDAKSLRLCLDYPSRQVRYLLPPQNIESGE